MAARPPSRNFAAPSRIPRGQHHAERDAFAVQQAVGKAGLCFQRMAESVAEIEQCARAGRLALVLGDDAGLRGDAGRDGVFERRFFEREVNPEDFSS